MGYGKQKFVLWCDGKNDRKIKDWESGMEICRIFQKKYDCSYFVMGREICPDTGTHHLDGYYEYPTYRKWSTENNKFLKMFGKGYGDLVLAKGSAGENFDYSSKEERGYEEYGTAVANGESLTLTNIKDQLVNGETTTDDVCMERPEMYHMYGRTLSKIEDICMRKKFRNQMTTCTWYYGGTAVGKSHRAHENYHPDTHYLWKSNDKGWQDGYTQQKTVIINDFRGEIKYNEFLQLVDKWPHTVPRRGREPMPFTSEHIIVTSSLSPELVYRQRVDEDSLEQLLRRVSVVLVYSKNLALYRKPHGGPTTRGRVILEPTPGVEDLEDIL